MQISSRNIIFRLISSAILSVLYTLMFAVILYGTWRYRLDHTIFDLCYAFVFFIFLYEAYKLVVRWFRLNITYRNHTVSLSKLIQALLVFILMSWLLFTLVAVVPFFTFMDGFVSPVDGNHELRMNYVFNMAFAVMYFTLLTGFNMFKQVQQLKLEAEKLERERTLVQMESLKNQISPHFLFNSLNAISSLIQNDEQTAARFVDELAEVFRYVMQHQNRELVELKDEMDFIHKYFFLLKIRFRNSITLEVNIENEFMNHLMPPLTIQLLVENVIKHNIVSKQNPLNIEIFTRDEYLIVRNNFQKREHIESSTGVGLNNIINRYQYMSSKEVKISTTEKHFEVEIPLLKGEAL